MRSVVVKPGCGAKAQTNPKDDLGMPLGAGEGPQLGHRVAALVSNLEHTKHCRP